MSNNPPTKILPRTSLLKISLLPPSPYFLDQRAPRTRNNKQETSSKLDSSSRYIFSITVLCIWCTRKKKEGEAPLARSSSVSSCVSSGRTPPQGYQTPVDDDDEPEDEPPPLTPRAASLLQAPTPNSAVMTVSLEGYLEPTRISFGSPPSSELNPRGPSPDETFPVFSPPPYDRRAHDRSLTSSSIRRHRRQSSFIGPPWMNGLQTPRQSIVSTASRSPQSHHTCNDTRSGTRSSSSIRYDVLYIRFRESTYIDHLSEAPIFPFVFYSFLSFSMVFFFFEILLGSISGFFPFFF